MRHALRLSLAALLALGATAVVAPLDAQDAPAARAAQAISGEVLHDETALPLADATVLLERAAAGEPAAGEPRTARTDAAGRYRFDAVPAGRWVLRVHRMGYRPATLEVELREGGARVSVGLTVVPIRLVPVEVTAPAPDSLAAGPHGMHGGRIDALRDRQRRYLGTEVREVTQHDVRDGLTPGESDLLRAVQRMPGVGAESDWSAELQTRGARWDQTRVLFDGLPLFNPVHAGGLVSAVSSDAIGAAFLHSGVRPAAIGEGSAAVLDLQSRPSGGDGGLQGATELSVVSARTTLGHRLAEGRGALMVGGRRTYLDLLADAATDGDDVFPYQFTELVGRFDWTFDGGRTLEVSALSSRDGMRGNDFGPFTQADGTIDSSWAFRENDSRWGNVAARVTLGTPLRAGVLGRVLARHTLGTSRNHARWGGSTGYAARAPLASNVDYTTLGGELAPLDDAARAPRWSLGWALVRQRADVAGRVRWLYVGEDFSPDTVARHAGTTSHLALWGERRFQPLAALTIAPSLRVESGERVRDAGAVRAAPRIGARLALPDSATFVSAAVGRAWQYAQALAPVPHDMVWNGNRPVPLWLMADEDTPALMTDVATLGVERWLGARWHASVNAYARRAVGLLGADPRPGPFTQRALYLPGTERARGVDASLRRLEGRWTMAAGYSLGIAETEAAGLRYASPADRRHALDLSATLRATRRLRLGAAFGVATGAPYTRVIPGTYHRDAEGELRIDDPPRADVPSGARLADHASLDVMAEWTGTIRGAQVTTYLQAYNVLMRRNQSYPFRKAACPASPDVGAACPGRESFGFGLYPVPLLGVRVSF